MLYILGDLAQMKQRLDDAYDIIEKHNQQMYLAAYNELSGRLELKLGEAADASLLLAKAGELFKFDGCTRAAVACTAPISGKLAGMTVFMGKGKGNPQRQQKNQTERCEA